MKRWEVLTKQGVTVRLPNVPKRTPARSISDRGERNLAKRVERERTACGWSYEALAQKMAGAGCAINKGALYSIEKSGRRITVDELMAFAEIFAEGDVADLLKPIELIEQERAHALIQAVGEYYVAFADAATKAFDSLVALYELAYENRELAEYVANHLSARNFATSYELGPDQVDEDGEAVGDLALLRAVKADHDHQEALRRTARMWAAYRAGDWTDDDQRYAEAELVKLRQEVKALGMEVTYEEVGETD